MGTAFAAEAGRAAGRVTVGDLAAGLVQAAEMGGSEAARRAAADLQKSLVAGNLHLPLTEGLAANLLRGIGVAASTSTPDRFVSQARLETLLHAAANSLANPAAATRDASPATLDDCLMESNHGHCVVCCKALGLRANSCAKACFVINKPSPSEPLP
jgi:hypothetical protein